MGKMDLHGQRYILADGTKAQSVTTVINQQLGWNKQALINWATRITLGGQDAGKVLTDAGDIGTLLHILIEGHQQEFDVDTKDYSAHQLQAAMKAFMGYLAWYEKTKFNALMNEIVLVNEEWRVGGTIDCIGKLNGDLVIVDWKTARYLYKEHKLQLGAYTYMYEQAEPRAKVKYGLVMRFGKDDGKFHQHKVSRDKLDAGAEIFEALLKVSALKNSI